MTFPYNLQCNKILAPIKSIFYIILDSALCLIFETVPATLPLDLPLHRLTGAEIPWTSTCKRKTAKLNPAKSGKIMFSNVHVHSNWIQVYCFGNDTFIWWKHRRFNSYNGMNMLQNYTLPTFLMFTYQLISYVLLSHKWFFMY